MTLSAHMSGERRQVTWTRDKVIAAIQRWNSLYGEPPRAADWNPSSAKWCAQTWRIDRYRKGDPDTGEPWPSLNAAKAPFGGSLNEAIRAAGLEPNRPGPPRRKDVVLDERVEMHPTVRVALDAAHARVRDLEEHTAVLERQLERARAARKPAPVRTKTKTTVKVKERIVRVRDEAALTRAVDRIGRAAERKVAKFEAKAAEAAEAKKAAETRAKNAELEVARLKGITIADSAVIAELKDDVAELRESARAAELAEHVALEALEHEREEIARLRAAQKVIVKDAPEQAILDNALADAEAANAAAREADAARARAERDYYELVAASRGERRRLTQSEIDELRASGPAGPQVLAQAIGDLAKARKAGGNPTAIRAALTAVASAAVSWRERL